MCGFLVEASMILFNQSQKKTDRDTIKLDPVINHEIQRRHIYATYCSNPAFRVAALRLFLPVWRCESQRLLRTSPANFTPYHLHESFFTCPREISHNVRLASVGVQPGSVTRTRVTLTGSGHRSVHIGDMDGIDVEILRFG
ncbi:unnamed protein product [Calypogeia fissa]